MSLAYSKVEPPRDFKIPDDGESENTPYSDLVKSGELAIGKKSGNSNVKGTMHKNLVAIDPGHGGIDPGANIDGLSEKEINLDIALRVNSILRSWGIPTYMTRSDDSFIPTKERIYTANDKKAALFVSIHSNWFSDTSLNGTMTLYYPSERLSVGNLSELDYAKTIQSELSKSLESKNRGIIDRPNLTVLKHASMPSVIVELGFLSNKKDAELLASDSFRQKAAEALAEGIKKSLDLIN